MSPSIGRFRSIERNFCSVNRLFGVIRTLGYVATIFFVLNSTSASAQQQIIRILLDTGFERAGREFIARTQKYLPSEASSAVRFEVRAVSTSELLPSLRSDGWEMAILSSTAITQAKIATTAAVFELPYIFPDLKSALEIQNSPVGRAGLSGLTELGLTAFVYLNAGPTLISSRTEPKGPSDLKGKKVAVFSSFQFQTFSKIGASPINMQNAGKSEIVQALEKGAIDASEFNSTNSDTWSFRKGDFLLTNNLQTHVAIVTTRNGVWDKIPFVYRASIGDAAIAATRDLDQALLETEKQFLAQAKSNGVSFVTFKTDVASRAAEQWIEEQPAPVRLIYSTAYDRVQGLSKQSPKDSVGPDRKGMFGTVHFATTREDTGSPTLAYRFDDSRTDVVKCGQIEYPQSTASLADARFAGQVRASNTDCNSYIGDVIRSGRQTLIFVHGFNNRFSEGLERASILKSALGNDVEVILWSWPSKRDGYFGNYDYDKESVGGVARQLFVRLLRSAKLASEQKAVHILAHSMGGWHTVGVLQVLSDDPNRPTLRNVILAAPDIPTNELEFALADMQRLTKRVTLYACESDWALTISRGMNDYPRGGMGGPRNILTNNMLDSIDVEARLFSTNHSYVFEAGKVLSDVASIVSGNDINLRGLIKTPKDGHYFWRFP